MALRLVFFSLLIGNRFTIGHTIFSLYVIFLIPLFLLTITKEKLKIPFKGLIVAIGFLVIIICSYLLNLNSLSILNSSFYLGGIYWFLSIIILAYIAINLNNNTVIKELIISITILCFLSILDVFLKYSGIQNEGLILFLPDFVGYENEIDNFTLSAVKFSRLNFFFSDPSVAGLIFLCGLIICYYYNFSNYFKFILFIGIILTLSSSAIALMLLFFLVKRPKLTLITSFILGLIFLTIINEGLKETIFELIQFRFSPGNSLSSHLYINNLVLNIFLNHPFGLGFKNFDTYFPVIYSAHNSFLQIAAELGVFGMTFLFVILSLVFYNFLNQKSKITPQILIIILLASFAHDFLLRLELLFIIILLYNYETKHLYDNRFQKSRTIYKFKRPTQR